METLRLDKLPTIALALVASVAAFVAAVSVNALLGLLGGIAECKELPAIGVLSEWYMVVVIGPALETLVLAAFVSLLRKVVGFWPVVSLTGLFWAILHGASCFAWGVVLFIPFALDAAIFLIALKRHGGLVALLFAFAVHAAYNALSLLAS